jgi:mannitol-specific phosphotransferase system IIBC component
LQQESKTFFFLRICHLPAMELLPLLGLALVYLMPTVAAYSRGHRQATAIAALNVFLGWTVLGWVGALIWAVSKPSAQSTDRQ